jgi:hypothetical protein
MRSAHAVVQSVSVDGHVQVPALQVASAPQAWPQVPQCRVLVAVSTHRDGVPQLESPVPHVLQRPAMHTPPSPQFERHAPQFAASVSGSTQ